MYCRMIIGASNDWAQAARLPWPKMAVVDNILRLIEFFYQPFYCNVTF